METVGKNKLKTHMFEILRGIETSGNSVIITDFGKPVLRISPYGKKQSASEIFKDWLGKVHVDDDELLKSSTTDWEGELP